MAKKKQKSGNKGGAGSSFKLPDGFWAQVVAVLLFLLAGLLIVTWFQAGGPALDWLQKEVGMRLFGHANFIIPFILIYLGVAIFKDDNNKLPPLVYIASLVLLILTSGLFNIIVKSDIGGGLVGAGLNALLLKLIVPNLAVAIYIVLIIIDVFLLSQASFANLLKWFKAKFSKVSEAEATNSSKALSRGKTKFEINATVPTEHNAQSDQDDMVAAINAKRSADTKSSLVEDTPDSAKSALVAFQDPNWQIPPINLLGKKQNPADAGNVEKNAEIIQSTLREFGIDVEMTGASIGPSVTQYTLMPPSGVKLSRIASLETNLALSLAAQSLRIEAPIPGKRAVGIEVPNVKAASVRLRGILTSPAWTSTSEKMTFAVGRDTAGQAVVADLSDLPHTLIAGQTGSGKSVMINTLLVSLLYRNSPSDLKLILVDPKQVEMIPYEDIPHLITPIITEPEKTLSALKWAAGEMERRFTLMAKYKKKEIKSYNAWAKQQMQDSGVAQATEVPAEGEDMPTELEGALPYIVIVIDELSDLMMSAPRDVEALIVKIAQQGRAAGVHLVLATQRPSVNVVTGLIKANIPARFAFTTASQVDSKTILDRAGAEKLLGKGDMLMLTARMSKPKRVQGAWVSDEEVLKVTDYLRSQMGPQYDDAVVAQEVQLNGRGGIVNDFGGADDEIVNRAMQIILTERKASTSHLQRRLGIGYNRAARVMDELEDRGVVGPQDGSRPREILMGDIDDVV